MCVCVCIYFFSEGIQLHTMKNWRHLRRNQITRNIVHRTAMPQSPPKQAPWDLTQFSQSPSAASSCFPESHWWSGISSLSKAILVLGKARSRRHQTWAVAGLSHLGALMFSKITLHETWCMSRHVVVMKLPVTSRPQLQPSNHLNSFHRGMFKINKTWCRFIALLSHFECDNHTLHSLTDQYSEVVIVHACASQSRLLGCRVTSMSCKLFSLH